LSTPRLLFLEFVWATHRQSVVHNAADEISWLPGRGVIQTCNDGHDTRALQHYLGHKNIQHTVRYTQLSLARFRDFWED
jgi:hypothetical protein